MSETRMRLMESSFYERPVKLRLPFRFGVVTLTEAPQAFVRVRVGQPHAVSYTHLTLPTILRV